MESPCLRIWVLPVGNGDSIVLRFPDGVWGIVDSHHPLGAEAIDNPAAWAILKQEMLPLNERIGFIWLTHYHADHFTGMYQLLGDTRSHCVEKFGMFFHLGFSFRDTWHKHLPSELHELNKIQRDYFPSHGPRIHPFREVNAHADGKHKINDDICLEFLAPNSERITSYLDSVIKAAMRERPRPDCFNRIGLAFRLSFGRSQILFTDDIEEQSWEFIRERYPDLTPNWMMISHHGARANNPKWIWDWLAKGREQSSLHAVVSARGTKHHPHQEVLNEAGSRFTIHQTCGQATIKGSSAMTSILSATYQVPPLQVRDTWIRSFPQGRVCEFAIYSDGKVEIL